MDVRPGFKLTDVGVIPEDWEVPSVGKLQPFITSGSRGWARYYAELGAFFVRITNLTRQSIYLDLEDRRFVNLPPDEREGTRTQIQLDDVLISITADIGIVGYVDGNFPVPAYINQHIALIRFDPAGMNGQFASYFLASEASQKRFRAITDQGAKAGISLQTVEKLQVVAPCVKEQGAIAGALGDVDALLRALERLIAKKRDLKQAAMQQLLTGQTRLPGFDRDWMIRRVGDLGRIVTGGTPPTDIPDFWGEGYPWITPTDITSTRDMFTSERNLTRKGLGTIRGLPADSVLVTCIASIGKNAILRIPGGCNQQINAVIPNGSSAEFLYYLFDSNKAYLLENAGRTATSILSKRTFSKLAFRVPSLTEQTAIATVITDMDAEITALEQRLAKTRALKQGMMQELLTGRIRLVHP